MLAASEHFHYVESGRVGKGLKHRYMHYYVYICQCMHPVKTELN
jgi:hypothetical protein